MTVTRLSDDERDSETLLEMAEIHYRDVLGEMEILIQCVRDRDDLPETETKRVLTAYRRAVQTLYDERKRVEDLRRKQRGIVGDYAIDFDAARTEIARRLDRLRATRGAG
ncbi:hypothetical protein OCGS_2389 [Oceaniovalibus guishaninsula JLT2003]|uniref:Uncharacterized protein n=1 Tax=Oceaniovalibus guishaninsula JLT2003 TaxID=1231392 RepID=K2HAK1_9RHOB|nr:hypothetical protein [Oceaniovalibus guishaninsula]EKE43657.1 hypothetical protein OCGS_2389 [Oceaniovalibus guishaninsula JLT2003]